MIARTEIGVGSEFVGYRIDELIGRGGMGVVYRAFDLRLKRTVALKLMAPELSLDARFRERFSHEAELAISLEHPNVVPIHDAGDIDGRLYLAMRYVDGTDLRAILRAEGALDKDRTLALGRQVANALDAAHTRGLVHRDVKPSNVLLDANEHVYLADFGLTRRLDEEVGPAGEQRFVGTPAYLAPEQVEGGVIDGRTDVYSLGCLLYECLTGETPFVRDSRLAVAWAHLEEEPPRASDRRPELPQAIDAVIRKAMAKEPEDRYATCAALIAAAETAFGIRSRARGRRRLILATLGAAMLAAVAAAFLVGGGDATPTVVPDSLVKVDLESGKIVHVIPVGRNPGGGIELVGRYVFAASEGDGTLTRVDTRTGAVVNSGKFDASGGLAAEGAKRVWVASVRRRQVTLVDAALPLVEPEDPISSPRVPLPGDTSGTSLTVGGGALWIATYRSAGLGGGGVVERWRLHPPARQRTYRLGFSEFGNDITFGYGAAWIALGAPHNTLLRIDARSGRARRIPVGRFPDAVAVGFDSVWVVHKEDDTVRRIDPVTGRTRGVIAVGRMPFDVAVDQRSVWVTNECDGTLSRIDPATNRVVATIELGYHPQGLAVDGDFAWAGVGKNLSFGTCP